MEWKKIEQLNNLYEISDTGLIRKTSSQKILRPFLTQFGYKAIDLFINKKKYRVRIHRLVAQAFIPNPKNKECVNHINGIKHDNRVENLEWTTIKENNQHAVRTGLNDVGIKLILYINDKEVRRFNSYADAGRYLGVGRTTIYEQVHSCKHKYQRTKNVRWEII